MASYLPFAILLGVGAIIIGGLWLVHEVSVWSSKFALVKFETIRTSVQCKYCPERVHGCTHFGGVPSTWEHDDGTHFCKNPYSWAPPNAEAWHS